MGIFRSTATEQSDRPTPEAVLCAACKKSPAPDPVSVKVPGIAEMQTVCSSPSRCRTQAQAAGNWKVA
jgi:hypothetical protein